MPGSFESGLRAVLSDPRRIQLVFQPIVDLAHGVVVGYESLSRFDAEPSAPPDQWFEAADEIGMRGELEALAISLALQTRDMLPPNCFLSVNVGPHVLTEPHVQRAFSAGGDLEGVVVEITEQTAVEDYDVLRQALEPLRRSGAAIAVDDVGAGHSSLRHITALRPSFVKVDRGLVAQLDNDPAKAASVELLGTLAARLDGWLVAEGVERDSELVRLVELGVPLAQGHRFARPAPTMQQLDGETEDLLVTLRKRREDEGVGMLIEPCATLMRGATRSEISAELARESAVMLIDHHGRPVSLLTREAFLRGEQPAPISLSVEPGNAIAEVARRAIARPEEHRFDPMACCDERGRMVGLLRVERLVEALTRQPALDAD